MNTKLSGILGALVLATAGPATANELEVTHWWTSGSEAAAIRVLADGFEASGDRWVDGAIAGAGGVARPLITSRIIGGNPMGATQFTHGQAIRELIVAGYMRDITDLAQQEGWLESVFPTSLLDSCTYEDRLYCVPSNIHSQQWLWLSHAAFAEAGLEVPRDWHEFVAAAPALREHGIVPLAQGQQAWQKQLMFNVLMVSVGGPETFLRVYRDLDADFAAGPEVAAVFQATADAREMMEGSNVQEWNVAARMVIDGRAGGQIMGDWVQGEFTQAGLQAGQDFTCLLGLGVHGHITAAGDAFYFPRIDSPSTVAAQDNLARVILDPAVQVAFTAVKGALPVRRDVTLQDPTPCMQSGIEALHAGNVIDSANSLVSPDTLGRITDLVVEFLADPRFSPADAQAEFAQIIATAD